jgi:Spy/CpxP family protein refolding chaperone
MKRILFITSLVLVSSLALADSHSDSQGQGSQGKGGEGRGGGRLQRMQQHLNLSDEQVSEIRSIKQNGGSREDVRAVLNDEQRAMMKQHRQRKGAERHPPPEDEGV